MFGNKKAYKKGYDKAKAEAVELILSHGVHEKTICGKVEAYIAPLPSGVKTSDKNIKWADFIGRELENA